jgi:hypothetical protein
MPREKAKQALSAHPQGTHMNFWFK